MSGPTPIGIECPECQGSGSGGFTPDCCGMVYELGYCRGDCAIPRPTPCEMCGGYGQVPHYEEPTT